MSIEGAWQALLFFLPAGIANMTPIFASKLPILKNWTAPLDFGKELRGKRIFGPNKTIRGLLTGTVTAGLSGLLLHSFLLEQKSLLLFVTICAVMGFGALFGDAIESFFKRQKGIASGKAWFPFDQTDYIIGGLLFVAPFGVLSLWLVLWIFIIYFGLHLVSSYVGYLLGLKDEPI